jgi:signal transduction histidine kinase
MLNSTILIIDDEQSYLDIITNTLKSKNHRVLQALNGRMGCKVAERFLPDIIIMDWEMPEMNGIEAIKYLKKQPTTQEIPIIMATGVMTAVEHLETALEAGAVDYIRKPIDPIELYARINATLKLSRSYKEIKDQKISLEDLNREKDGMIGIVAHDLRAPLNRIMGLTEIIKMSNSFEKEQATYIEMIEKMCHSGISLIRDLLVINNVEYESQKLNLKEIALYDFIADLLKNYTSQAQQKQIKIHLEKTDAPIFLETDESFLGRILDNLISNALKFSYREKNVYISIKNTDTRIQIAVKDEGQGISQEDQQKMFKKFQKLSARPTGGEESTGLGLAIVKSLVEKLNGNIHVVSNLGEGAEFIIEFDRVFVKEQRKT